MPITDQELRELRGHAKQLRKDIIDVTFWAGGAHIGGALSLVEIMILLYYKYLHIDPDHPDMPERDRFILSKGHAGVGFAPMLARRGYFDFELLKDFNKFNSPFGMHLDGNKVKGADVSTGSLGHGLSMAVGMALGARLKGRSWRTYCVLGDGECNEGSVWEAAMAAAHYKTTNLITFVDRNKYSVDGPTETVMGIEPLGDKWRAFGFIVKEVDGHSYAALSQAIEEAQAETKAPVVIIAHTIKGKGVDFMEDDVRWHYGGLDSDKIVEAKRYIETAVIG
ncbi:MAG: transketolase [Syntrophales bacterium]|jgi:transketolase|nr:transketolase [Syntrophales bacterium]MDD4340548.1 transketolase [Syntrophales bacterium]HOG18754.1 transketolase [Syntrophales bacterium]HPB70969.1 transketolase [Syntrophales bacterium]HQN26687.1 transketolase [Syntrophales bacterium]